MNISPIIKTKNLSVAYNLGKSYETRALEDVNIEIYPGEYVVFYGPSGCGKSTLLYCLAGLETPTRGEVIINKKSLSTFTDVEMVNYRRLSMGMIFQSYNLIPTLNVLDNVLLPNILGGLIPEISMPKAQSLLERFEISKLARRYPSELSGGQQQRVAIARALIYWPFFLFADEPVGNLDSESARIVMNLLSEINEKDDKIVILVTHDPVYLDYAHRVFHMKDGKILRETVNQEKVQLLRGPKKEQQVVSSELQKFGRVFPYLTKEQLQSKILANYLTDAFDIDKMGKLEKTIENFISGRISEEAFYGLLNTPYAGGGVGLYEPTAQKYRAKIKEIMSQANFLKEEIKEEQKTEGSALLELDKSIMSIRRHLLDSYQGEMTYLQMEKLEKNIKGRLLGSLDRKMFQKYLDIPLKEGGVGLNKKTAARFTKEVEIIIAQAKQS